jgi:hypothetical protein
VTEAEYLEPARLPWTNRHQLSFEQQAMLDAINLDNLCEANDLGKPLTNKKLAILAELTVKARHRAEISRRR